MGRLAIYLGWRSGVGRGEGGARQDAPSFVMGWAWAIVISVVLRVVVGGDGGRR